jgi:hypothetical protein
VNGPALVYIGPQGATGSLSYLGYTEDGADVSVRHHYDEIKGDVGGHNIPQDLQDMGMDARIRLRLVAYDLAVLQSYRSIGMVDGEQPAIGRLVGSNNEANRLVIASADEPWRFLCTVCRDAQSARIGVRKTVWDLDVYAWTFIDAAQISAAGLPLFDHVNG